MLYGRATAITRSHKPGLGCFRALPGLPASGGGWLARMDRFRVNTFGAMRPVRRPFGVTSVDGAGGGWGSADGASGA